MNKFSLFISLVLGLALAINVGHSQTDLFKDQSLDGGKGYKQELNQWILRAYEGDRDAQFKVGVLLSNDQQVDTPDYEQAVYWYKQAALQGHVLAQYNLGHQYLAGLGAERSESEAMEWWLKAAEQDHALAQFNVGRGYYLGIGLSENHKKSRFWFERAAKNGEPKSIEILEQISWSNETAESGETLAKSDNSNNNSANQSQSAVGSSVTSAGTLNQSTVASVTPVEDPPLKSVITESRIEPIEQLEPNEQAAPAEQLASLSQAAPKPVPAVSPEAPEPASTAVVVETASTNEQEIQYIKLFTDPKNRDRLIAFANLDGKVAVKKREERWSSITHSNGFPVWVHGDFVSILNNQGKITGSNVNARSEPKITKGSIVGRLNKGETLQLLQHKGAWYQLTSPSRFVAWVRTADLESYKTASAPVPTTATTVATTGSASLTSSATESTAQSKKSSNEISEKTSQTANVSGEILNDSDSNEWLFSQSPDGYTLQLATFSEKDNATRFLEDRNINSDPNLRAFASRQDSNNWTYYLYGSYLSQNEAKKAKKGLKLPKAWVRTFEELQQNRCVTWKTQLPTPRELKTYCVQ